jgi:hypothetical protein
MKAIDRLKPGADLSLRPSFTIDSRDNAAKAAKTLMERVPAAPKAASRAATEEGAFGRPGA